MPVNIPQAYIPDAQSVGLSLADRVDAAAQAGATRALSLFEGEIKRVQMQSAMMDADLQRETMRTQLWKTRNEIHRLAATDDGMLKLKPIGDAWAKELGVPVPELHQGTPSEITEKYLDLLGKLRDHQLAKSSVGSSNRNLDWDQFKWQADQLQSEGKLAGPYGSQFVVDNVDPAAIVQNPQAGMQSVVSGFQMLPLTPGEQSATARSIQARLVLTKRLDIARTPIPTAPWQLTVPYKSIKDELGITGKSSRTDVLAWKAAEDKRYDALIAGANQYGLDAAGNAVDGSVRPTMAQQYAAAAKQRVANEVGEYLRGLPDERLQRLAEAIQGGQVKKVGGKYGIAKSGQVDYTESDYRAAKQMVSGGASDDAQSWANRLLSTTSQEEFLRVRESVPAGLLPQVLKIVSGE